MFRLSHSFILALFLLGNAGLHAQLVNGSFEQYSSLPLNLGEWQVAPGWNNANSLLGSPDYFHYLANNVCDVPETPFALVNPYQGEALMGLIVCGRKHTNIREYLTNEFSSPLIVGRQYNLRFRLTNGLRTTVSASGLAVSDLGLLLTTTQPTQIDYGPINATPHFKIDTVFYSPAWQTVNFTFTADQPYRYMTFGLFGDDSDKQITIYAGQNPSYSYCFVDDFALQAIAENYDPLNPQPIKDDPKSTKPENQETPQQGSAVVLVPYYIPNSFTPNNDGHNDDYKPVIGELNDWTFEIFSLWGELIFQTTTDEFGWDGRHKGIDCNVGNYVWRMTYPVYDDKGNRKLVVEKGVVTLIR